MLNKDHLIEMEDCLRLNMKNLLRLLREPEDFDNSLTITGILRILLTDSTMPVLIAYAKEFNIFLPISGVHNSPIDDNTSGLVFAVQFPSSGWSSLITDRTVSIETFLDTPLGVTPVKGNKNHRNSSSYTPRQIIKLHANQCGIAHLDLKKSGKLKSLHNYQRITNNSKAAGKEASQKCIYNLANWTFHAINYLLLFSNQDQVVNENLKFLKRVRDIDILQINRFCHYMPFKDNILSSFLPGLAHVKIEKLNADISNGFSVHFLIKIIEHKEKEAKIIYELINNKNSLLNITLTADYNLEFNLSIPSNEVFSVLLPEKFKSSLKNKFCSLSCFVSRTNKNIQLSVFINGVKAFSQKLKNKCDYLKANMFVIGADIEGGNGASFFMIEFILADVLKKNTAPSISKYLWNNMLPPIP